MATKINRQTRIKRIEHFDHDFIVELFTKADLAKVEPSTSFFDDDKNILLVSYTNRAVSGFLYAYILSSLRTNLPKIFLYSIDVFEEFRRKGIATKLIDELKKLAFKNNCGEIFVFTNKKNEAALKLYQTTGGKAENNDDLLFVYQISNSFMLD